MKVENCISGSVPEHSSKGYPSLEYPLCGLRNLCEMHCCGHRSVRLLCPHLTSRFRFLYCVHFRCKRDVEREFMIHSETGTPPSPNPPTHPTPTFVCDLSVISFIICPFLFSVLFCSVVCVLFCFLFYFHLFLFFGITCPTSHGPITAPLAAPGKYGRHGARPRVCCRVCRACRVSVTNGGLLDSLSSGTIPPSAVEIRLD